jgi:transcriptional regulator with XRE-family HTH domain
MASRKVTYLSPFYGYPPKVIAAWCGVSVQTARAYKNGSKRPSRSVMRLFRLHREFRVLGESWDGWLIKDDGIVDPDGNVTTRPQLLAYWIVMQYAAELARSERESPTADGLRVLLRRA